MSRFVFFIGLVAMLMACRDEPYEVPTPVLPDFRLPGIHANLKVVRADSLFLTGNLLAAAIDFKEALSDSNATDYALARLAEIDYFQKILHGHTYVDSFDSIVFDTEKQHGNFFAWATRFYRDDDFKVDSFFSHWQALYIELDTNHYWVHKGHLILGEYYKNRNFNRDSSHLHFVQFLKKTAQNAGSKYYDFYWCYERLSEIMMYTREHLHGVSYAEAILQREGWVCEFDNEHQANVIASRAHLIIRHDRLEEALEENLYALNLLKDLKHTRVFQKALKGCLVTCDEWNKDALFHKYAQQLASIINETGYDYMNYHRLMAIYHHKRGNDEIALPHFADALDLCFKEKYMDIPAMQSLCFRYSASLERLGNYPGALSIYRISDDYKRPRPVHFEDLLAWKDPDPFMCVSYARYANIYLSWSKASRDTQLLSQAEILALKADSLAGTLRYTDEESILTLLVEYQQMSSVLAAISLEKFRTWNNPTGLEEYFIFTEKMRGNLQWRDVLANADTSIIALVDTEHGLRVRQKYLRGRNAAPELHLILDSLRQIQDLIAAQNASYSSLAHEPPTLSELQAKLQKDSAVMLMLNVIRDEIVVLAISDTAEELWTYPWNPTFEAQLRFLVRAMHGDTTCSAQTFSTVSHRMYKALGLDSPVLENGKRIFLMIDAAFNGMSFEALQTTDLVYTDFQDIPFLIYEHCIVHIPSAKRYLTGDSQSLSTGINDVAVFSWTDDNSRHKPSTVLAELSGTYKELELIRTRWANAQAYHGFNCNRDNFMSAYQTKELDLLHLATHAMSESARRDNVQLYLRDGASGIDTFYGYEVMSMKSDVQVVVLSACEAGSGKYETGDTQFNFPRYFLLNGAHTVISPIWSQDDRTSMQVFTTFYQEALHDIPENLQDAKIHYLKSEKIRDEKKAPYYWAGLAVYQ